MVTSSAVVGSSAISSFGRQAIAMAIITRWLMPPESWCGKAERRRSGSEMPTSRSSSIERSRRARAVEAEMRLQRLADLEADGEAGIEAGDRLLEDHRDVLADHLPAAARREREQVLAGEGQAVGGHRRGLRQEAHDGQHRHRLAGAGFADDRHHVAGIDVEVDAVHRLERPRGGGEGDGEVADFEEGHALLLAGRDRLYIGAQERSCRFLTRHLCRRRRPRSRLTGMTGPRPGY